MEERGRGGVDQPTTATVEVEELPKPPPAELAPAAAAGAVCWKPPFVPSRRRPAATAAVVLDERPELEPEAAAAG